MQRDYDAAARRRPVIRSVELLDGMIDAAALLDPATQVQLGATMFASMVLARSRMPSLLALLTSVGFGYSARRAYVVVHDIHLAALAIAAAADEDQADDADSQV